MSEFLGIPHARVLPKALNDIYYLGVMTIAPATFYIFSNQILILTGKIQQIHLKLCFDLKIHLKLYFDVKIHLKLCFDVKIYLKLCFDIKIQLKLCRRENSFEIMY